MKYFRKALFIEFIFDKVFGFCNLWAATNNCTCMINICKKFMMKSFATIVNSFELLIIVGKHSVSDICRAHGHASEKSKNFICLVDQCIFKDN